MKKYFPSGLTYDDILLIPQYSDISSRKLIDISTKFSRNVNLKSPIVSANMDTVTESRMAIAMALEGGLGVIHRFLSIEEQAVEVRKVKRAQNLVIDDPATISQDATLEQAVNIMRENNISGLIVCADNGTVRGIITLRDVRFKNNLNGKVKDCMTPREKLITAPRGITAEKALYLFDKHKIEKLPLVDAKDKLIGLITASDFQKAREHAGAAKDKQGKLLVGAAVGVKDGVERAEALVEAGADVLVIDIAHGHHKRCVDLTKDLKKKFDIDVVAGNVATAEGARDLIKAGADAIKVGIGPGAACSTRIVAGAGVPQLSAILDVVPVVKKANVPLIADGGIKNSGDVAKAIAAGASTVMIGNLFSGTYESPGTYYIEDGEAFKIYRGLASRDASIDRQQVEANAERQDRAPEGISFRVTYKGEVQKFLQILLDGLQSGMSYTGAKNISEFWKKARFVRMTEAGARESSPRNYQV
ncbi:MAG: IMP dehydrogenase [Candidatus Spechtbacteria bacterium]|nr:IMP dehydrogenase [Candidatus Spechtbacteria bacterium]